MSDRFLNNCHYSVKQYPTLDSQIDVPNMFNDFWKFFHLALDYVKGIFIRFKDIWWQNWNLFKMYLTDFSKKNLKFQHIIDGSCKEYVYWFWKNSGGRFTSDSRVLYYGKCYKSSNSLKKVRSSMQFEITNGDLPILTEYH